MTLRQRYANLIFWKKVAFWGCVVSIAGLGITLPNCVFEGTISSLASSLETQEKALNIIGNFADRLCETTQQSGGVNNLELSGSAKGELSQLIRQIANLGIEGAAKYQTSEWQGLLQKDLADQLNKSRDCKLEVFRELKGRLLDAEYPSPTPKPSSKTPSYNSPQLNTTTSSQKKAGDNIIRSKSLTLEEIDEISSKPIKLRLKSGKVLVGEILSLSTYRPEGFIDFLSHDKHKKLKERYGNQHTFKLPIEEAKTYIDQIAINQIESYEIIETTITDLQIVTEGGKKIEVEGLKIQLQLAEIPGYVKVSYQTPYTEKYFDLGSLEVKNSIVSLPITMAFISYLPEDKEKVDSIVKDLNNYGIIAWFDENMLLPGDNWRMLIEQAIEKADYFLIFLSNHTDNEASFKNRELYLALYQQTLRPFEKRFIIPIILDDSDIPYKLKELSWVKTTDNDWFKKLLRSIAPRHIKETLH